MLLIVPPENLEHVLKIFRDEQTEANAIGRYSDSGIARLTYENEMVAQIDLKSLFNPPKTKRTAKWADPRLEEPVFDPSRELGNVLLKLLMSYNIASKEKVVRRYDQEVKGQTVIKPMQGWNAGPSDGAVMKPLPGSMVGISISSGINPRYGKISPYWMAASVIDEAIRNNIAVGGRRIALLDNFTWGSPEYPDRIGSLVEACKACYDFGIAYGTPFISGKDSLYNESPLGPIVPTLLITALGIVPSVSGVVNMDLKEVGNRLYIVGETAPELGGSEYYHLMGHLGASVPKLDAVKTSTAYRLLTAAIDAGCVRSCHDLSEGGLAVSLAEMAFTGGLGLEVDLARVPATVDMRDDLLLYSESNGRLLVEVHEGYTRVFEELMKGSTVARIGSVVKEPRLRITRTGKAVIDLANEDTIKAWKTPLEAQR